MKKFARKSLNLNAMLQHAHYATQFPRITLDYKRFLYSLFRPQNRNAEANLKSAKHHTQLPVMPSDCQLDQPMHRRNPSGTSTPIVAGDSRRLSPQFMADPPDIDDTDPDVIPNQHGKSKEASHFM